MVLGIARSEPHAAGLVAAAGDCGFSRDGIAVVFPEQARAGRAEGGTLRAWLAGIGRLASGAGAGGIARQLVGLGVRRSLASRYERKVRAGGILLSIRTESADEVARAEELLGRGGAEDVFSTHERGRR
ncbi:MAG TPA: hypothetical protein VMS22_21410 [Candidatus Eisenbacteria bacterium]|nr:hypothetical protein [Candidatus Eisenbacteria bacterium]